MGCFVVNHPQTQQHRTCAGREETACEADELVAGRDDVRAGFARAQRNEGVVEFEAVGVANREPAVRKPQRGKERIVGTELPVTREVDDIGVG